MHRVATHPDHGLITFSWLLKSYKQSKKLTDREKKAVKGYLEIKEKFLDKSDPQQYRKATAMAEELGVKHP